MSDYEDRLGRPTLTANALGIMADKVRDRLTVIHPDVSKVENVVGVNKDEQVYGSEIDVDFLGPFPWLDLYTMVASKEGWKHRLIDLPVVCLRPQHEVGVPVVTTRRYVESWCDKSQRKR